MNYQGFHKNECESFVHDDVLTHVCEAEIKYGLNLPAHILSKYEADFEADAQARKELKIMGIPEDEMLEQFIKCRFGGNDNKADISGNKLTPDYWQCGKHGVCEHEFVVCRPVITETGEKLTRCEIAVMKQITLDLSDKEIADKLCVSVNTICSHRVHLTQKIGCNSKNGIVRFAIEKGITL